MLTGVRQEMEIIRGRSSARSLPVVTFEDLDEAIAYANDSDYGLTSSIYTRDLNVALAGLPGDPLRRDLHQPRELRGHAGLPRRLAQERHRRRRRQARASTSSPRPTWSTFSADDEAIDGSVWYAGGPGFAPG